MAFEDIVLDTNVLMHANNSQEPRQEESINLLNILDHSSVHICLDEGFAPNEAQNESRIWLEYRENLKTPGTRGRTFMEGLLRNKRIKEVSDSVEDRLRRIINQSMNRDKPVDKIFIKVTCNSNEKLLVSHDYTDFSQDKRNFFKRKLEIQILEAKEVITTVENHNT